MDGDDSVAKNEIKIKIPQPSKDNQALIKESCRNLEEMFKNKLDSDVIQMIFAESDFNVDNALENLFQLIGEQDSTNRELRFKPNIRSHSSYYEALTSQQKSNAPNTDNASQILPKKPIKPYNHNSTILAIDQCEKALVLMRGLPGSGKSFLASKIVKNGVICSADDFFYSNGSYLFDPNGLEEAHERCKKKAEDSMKKGLTPIIIDNTNLTEWEMRPYISKAIDFNYSIFFLQPGTPWQYNIKYLSRKNLHGITRNKLERLMEKFEVDLVPEIVIQKIKNIRNSYCSSYEKCSLNPDVSSSSNCIKPSTNIVQPIMIPLKQNRDEKCLDKEDDDKFLENNNSPAKKDFVALSSTKSSFSLPIDLPANNNIMQQRNLNKIDYKKDISKEEDFNQPWEPEEIQSVKLQNQSSSSKLLGVIKANWEFPPYPISKSSPTEKLKVEEIILISRGTQVENHDWMLLEMESGISDFDSLEINKESNILTEYKSKKVDCRVIRMDKGTSTEDLPGELTTEEKIAKLQENFPQALEEQLQSILESCHGDYNWASCLLSYFNDQHFETDIPLLSFEMNENSEIEETESEHNNSFILKLDPGFAKSLEENFGVINKEGKDEDYFNVKISRCVARFIHQLWKNSIQQIKSDSNENRKYFINPTHPKRTKLANSNKNLDLIEPRSSFQEIMQLETALDISWKEFYKSSKKYKNLMSTKLKLNHLKSTYPGIDEATLENIFEANSDTIETIRNDLGVEPNLTSSVKDLILENEDLHSDSKAELRQEKTFNELRKEMEQLKRDKKETIEKGRESFKARQYATASHYSNKVRDIQKKIEDLQESIINNVVENSSNKLDLHGVLASEVTNVLRSFIISKQEELSKRHLRRIDLDIITGRGVHSPSGPKIKPIVLQYLRQKNYRYNLIHPGLIRVVLT